MSGPEVFHFDEVFGAKAEPQIHLGTAGWDDADEWVDQGTDANGGYTFLRVQLFRGRDHSKPIGDIDAEIGHGQKILCSISGGLFRIPPKGTRCYVAMPAGYEHIPGAAIVFATVEKSPTIQLDKDRVQLNFGPDTHVVIKGKSVVISDTNDDFIGVGTPRSGGAPGINCRLKDGTGFVVQAGTIGLFTAAAGDIKSMLQMNNTEIRMTESSGTMFFLKGAKICATAPTIALAGGNLLFGVGPAFQPVLVGLAGPAGTPSLSIYGSFP